MKSYKEELWFNTENRYELLHITDKVRKAVKASGVKEGLCLVNAMHISASVFINDNESGLHQDFLKWLEELAPYSKEWYKHNLGEDNADAHLKRSIVGSRAPREIPPRGTGEGDSLRPGHTRRSRVDSVTAQGRSRCRHAKSLSATNFLACSRI